MAAPDWTFAPSGNGEKHGFHNPGVETFKDNLERYLAREAIQNSIDACSDHSQPVHVTFELIEMDRDNIPGMDDLVDTFPRCSAYWPKDNQAKKFFERATGLAKADTVSCLRIGDSNATGVPGTDDDNEEGWSNLVRSSGSSAKGATAGGSFGLGKHAPFAASRLRTVFYSTRLEDDSCAFQGVTRLVTHVAPGEKVQRQPTGFLGGADGRSLRNKTHIPKAFRRTEAGTDVYVLGYHAEEQWEEEVIYSVLENFWPAVQRKLLTVTVGKTTISKKNLGTLLMHHGNEHKDFEAHLYHRAYTDPASNINRATLPNLGCVSTFFLVGEPGFPSRVAMVRKNGLVVYRRRGRSKIPYCGVFECLDEKGNVLLRDMEPPRHDDWSADLPEKGVNRKAKKELDDYILGRINSLTPVSTESTITIPDLSQYLPDDGDTPEDAFDGPPADGAGTHENFDRTPKAHVIPGQNMARKKATRPGGATAGPGDDGTGGDDDDGDGPNDTNGGKSKKDGDNGEGTAGGPDGRTPVDVRARAFLTDGAAGVYSVTVHPPHPRPAGEVILAVAAVGDDTNPSPVRVQAARVAGGKKLTVPALGRVGPVAFPKNGPLRVEVTLAEPRRLALQVTAEEVSADAAE